MIYWERIVIVRLPSEPDVRVVITNAKAAGMLLLEKWPDRTGRSYKRAVLSCLAAINGQLSHEAAQWAFVVAAMEAAVPYEVKDRLEAEIASVCSSIIAEERPPVRQRLLAAG